MKKTNKILVKLYVPLIEIEHYVWLPINKKIYEIIDLLVKSINDLVGGYYVPSSTPLLYDKQTAKPYDINLDVKKNKIKNGSEIILI